MKQPTLNSSNSPLQNSKLTFLSEPLARHTTFRIGGKAQYFVIALDLVHLKDIIKFVKENRLAYFVIGAGSNLLISDQGFSGMVIKLGKEFNRIKVQNNQLICGAGVKLNDLVKTAASYGLSGQEFLYGIPGTVGGAIKNNAGAFNHSIAEIIQSVHGIQINLDSEIQDLALTKDQIGFSYRKSQIPKDFIITHAVIKLYQANPTQILAKLKQIKQARKKTQPWGASAGCIFRNPQDNFAGKLLDEAGLKGTKIGDAYVSKKHANFIINRGNASFNDVLELIQIMKMRVEVKTGIILEEEVEIIPNTAGTGDWGLVEPQTTRNQPLPLQGGEA